MTTRVVPFAERHKPAVAQAEPDAVEPGTILGPTGKPARLPKNAKCPSCGADADKRVKSGMGDLQEVTCGACAFEFPKERSAF